MTDKTAFDAEERYQLWKAPYTATLAIITAHPGGYLAEMVASAQATVEAQKIYQSELLRSLLAVDQSEASAFSERVAADIRQQGQLTPDDILALAIADVRAAIAILRLKAEPAEVQEYRQMILAHIEKVAQAGKEGSFLGFGGVRVSDAEELAIAEIRLAVNRLH